MTPGADTMFLIVDPLWQTATETCSGPDGSGRCPRAPGGGRVPCAGRELLLLKSDLSPRWSRSVSAGEDECPVPVMCAGGA
ncbi:MAG: hypothetical protein JOZ46_10495 [Candidatus Dormibacteraeota bacterium]|nr:hypothetical protein [Candidatus Dormibacteraeota bacterium]MBV9526228.1 hypothetical protein [Candidatus Dormibacteraeota bacterium]